jgi:hypothetical protein
MEIKYEGTSGSTHGAKKDNKPAQKEKIQLSSMSFNFLKSRQTSWWHYSITTI